MMMKIHWSLLVCLILLSGCAHLSTVPDPDDLLSDYTAALDWRGRPHDYWKTDRHEGQYVHGKKEGPWKYRYPNGILRCVRYYGNGQVLREDFLVDQIVKDREQVIGDWKTLRPCWGNMHRERIKHLITTGMPKTDVIALAGKPARFFMQLPLQSTDLSEATAFYYAVDRDRYQPVFFGVHFDSSNRVTRVGENQTAYFH
jgi:hypothetical protein